MHACVYINIMKLIKVLVVLILMLIYITYEMCIDIGALLGLPYIPAFANPTTVGSRILGGVNYASAAGGILDETGQTFVITYTHIYINIYC